MSIRKLPEIRAFERPSGVAFEPDDQILSKWNPHVRAASEGDEAVISIYDVIGEEMFGEGITARRIAGALRSIGSRDITVNVNSPGGDVFEGIAIYNLLREHPHRVTVKILGIAASAASVIAMAGDEIQISKIGFMMIHNSWAIAMGDRNDLRGAADVLEQIDGAMANLYSGRAGIGTEQAVEWMNKETWFGGEAAIEAGLANSLLDGDRLSESPDDTPETVAIMRRIEAALAQRGIGRKERREMIGVIASANPETHKHEEVAMHEDLEAPLRELVNVVKAAADKCKCGARLRPKAGQRLAARLNRLIDDLVTEDRSRADVIEDMADAAGISASTVNQILNAEINCPPRERLEGFAEVLDTTTESLIRTAEQDGCDFSEDED